MISRLRPWIAALTVAWLAWRVAVERFAPAPGSAPAASAPDVAAPPDPFAHAPRSPEEAALLSLDGRSVWPAARALESAGVPFGVTASPAAARAHRLVVLALDDRAATLEDAERDAWLAWLSSGGVLVLQAPAGGDAWRPLTGLERTLPSRERRAIRLRLGDDPAAAAFPAPADAEILLAGPRSSEAPWTAGLRVARGEAVALAVFDDREAAITVRRHGAGRVYALGVSFADLHARPLAGRHFEAARSPAGGAREDAADALPELLRTWAASVSTVTVRLRGLPGRALAVLSPSHELGDDPAALDEARFVAQEESSAGIKATWFVRTGPPGLDARRVAFLRELSSAGHEVASRGEVLPPDFDTLPFGDGTEDERNYRPVIEYERARGATVLGETAVSRARLRSLAGVEAAGFRGPAAAWPESLERALARAGYLYDATHSAAVVLTHRAFPHAAGRGFQAPARTIAIPVTLADRPGAVTAPSTALALLKRVAEREGVFSWILPPDRAGLAALKGTLARLPPGVEIMTLAEIAARRRERADARIWLESGSGPSRVLAAEIPPGGVTRLSVETSPAPLSCKALQAPEGATASCSGRLIEISSPLGGLLRLRLDFEKLHAPDPPRLPTAQGKKARRKLRHERSLP